MEPKELECACGQKVKTSPGETQKCPACGKELVECAKGSMGLSDSEIEATAEVMSEEGAIWSGAR